MVPGVGDPFVEVVVEVGGVAPKFPASLCMIFGEIKFFFECSEFIGLLLVDSVEVLLRQFVNSVGTGLVDCQFLVSVAGEVALAQILPEI